MRSAFGIVLLLGSLGGGCRSTAVTPTPPSAPAAQAPTPSAGTPTSQDETLELVVNVAQTTTSGFTLTLAAPTREDVVHNADPAQVSMPAISRLDVPVTVARNGASQTLHFSPSSPGTVTHVRDEWDGYEFVVLDVRYVGPDPHVSFKIAPL